jgi:hypothetical protein
MSEYDVIAPTSAFLVTAIIVLTIWTILDLKTAPTNFLRKRLLKVFARTKKYFTEKPLRLIPVGAVALVLLLCFIQMTMISRTVYSTVRYCPVHHCSTQWTLAEIKYGLLCINRDYERDEKKLFPLSNSSISGGCVVGRDRRYKWTMFCPECRLAESQWR